MTRRSTSCATSSGCTSSTRPTSRATPGARICARPALPRRRRRARRTHGPPRPETPLRRRLVAGQRVGVRAGPRRHGGGDPPARPDPAAALRGRVDARPRRRQRRSRDIVCPMYTPVERIVAWVAEGRDLRRPLILCEYTHAMGKTGSLADYCAAFEAEDGLQGGFIWEWVDHGLRRRDADGRRGSGTGATSVRELARRQLLLRRAGVARPHAAPGWPSWPRWRNRWSCARVRKGAPHDREPAVVHRGRRPQGRAGPRLHDGRVVAHGRLELPVMRPRSWVDVPNPVGRTTGGDGRHTMTIEVGPRRGRAPVWAMPGWGARDVVCRARRRVGVTAGGRSDRW